MNKIFCGVLAVVLLCGCLVGCSKKASVDVDSVISQLKGADIPIVYQIVFTDETDPNGSGTRPYLQKGNFADSRVESEYSKTQPESGSVEIFENKDAATARADYLKSFSVLDSMQYQILKDNILIRLNNAFTAEQVADYAKAIEGMLYNAPSEKTHKSDYSYGDDFINHANQLKEGMTLDEAIQIMGFEPKSSSSTYIWFDRASSNSVMAIIEDGKLKEIIASLDN